MGFPAPNECAVRGVVDPSGMGELGHPTMGIYTRCRAIIMYGWSKGARGRASWYGGAGGCKGKGITVSGCRGS